MPDPDPKDGGPGRDRTSSDAAPQLSFEETVQACEDLRRVSCERFAECLNDQSPTAVPDCLRRQTVSDGTCEQEMRREICMAQHGGRLLECADRIASDTCTALCGEPGDSGFQFCYAPCFIFGCAPDAN